MSKHEANKNEGMKRFVIDKLASLISKESRLKDLGKSEKTDYITGLFGLVQMAFENNIYELSDTEKEDYKKIKKSLSVGISEGFNPEDLIELAKKIYYAS